MKRYHITNIEWDTSDFSEEMEMASGFCVPDVPDEVEIESDEELTEKQIERRLERDYGFSPLDFDYDIVETTEG